MIHRILTKIQAFDAMFVCALAMAAYHHVGHAWLLYVIYLMAATFVWRIIKDISSWVENIDESISFIGRCIRDKEIR